MTLDGDDSSPFNMTKPRPKPNRTSVGRPEDGSSQMLLLPTKVKWSTKVCCTEAHTVTVRPEVKL